MAEEANGGVRLVRKGRRAGRLECDLPDAGAGDLRWGRERREEARRGSGRWQGPRLPSAFRLRVSYATRFRRDLSLGTRGCLFLLLDISLISTTLRLAATLLIAAAPVVHVIHVIRVSLILPGVV